jgi:hypothetical protein
LSNPAFMQVYLADALRSLTNKKLEILAVETSLATNEQLSFAVQKTILAILAARKDMGVDLNE